MKRAAACAQRNDPVRLTLITFWKVDAATSVLGIHPTIPAKQRSMLMFPIAEWAEAKAEETASSDVTSTGN